MKRIPEFEALRGLLALWVLIGHAVRHSVYESIDRRSFDVNAMPAMDS